MPPKSASAPSLVQAPEPVSTPTASRITFARVGDHTLPCPKRATPGSAGIDMAATHDAVIAPGNAVTPIRLGFAVAIPEGHVGLLMSRSGFGKHGVTLANSVGVIDSDYRGEVVAMFVKDTAKDMHVKAGDRVAQLVVVPIAMMEVAEAQTLPETKRGVGGFGSTGR